MALDIFELQATIAKRSNAEKAPVKKFIFGFLELAEVAEVFP
jgi:hypothetical protein